MTSRQAGPNAFPCGLRGRVLFCFTALFVPLGESQPRIGPAAPAGFLLASAGLARTQPPPGHSLHSAPRCARAVPRPSWHQVRNVCAGQAWQGGELLQKEREKLPPCSSCFRPSPISIAGKGRAQPAQGCVLLLPGRRPTCVRAARHNNHVSHAASLPCDSSRHAGSAGKGLAGTRLVVGLKSVRAIK